MKDKREIKEILNQNWYKRVRGGLKARENKDAPWLNRVKDERRAQKRKNDDDDEVKGRYKQKNDNDDEVNGDDKIDGKATDALHSDPLTKVTETIIFIPFTQGSMLKE